MSELKVEIPRPPLSSYPIVIEAGAIARLGDFVDLLAYSKVFLLTDETLAKLWDERLATAVPEAKRIVIASGEKAKEQGSLGYIWQELLSAGADRKSLLVNFGGGVIGDLGGFAASTYMRGIDFVQMPSTLLSQVDASVGGKTGMNFAGVKNIIGAFAQPRAVIVDTDTLSTLPETELRAGFAEVLKHGFIRDREYLDAVTQKDVIDYSPEEMENIILVSCRIKAAVVEEDEKESGLRKILNSGHTFGHAIESLSHGKSTTPLLHGEAVAIGMYVEAKLSEKLGLLQVEDVELIIRELQKQKLPCHISFSCSHEEILSKLLKDKKNSGGKILWTLLESIGQAKFDCEVPSDLLTEVSEEFLKESKNV